MLLHINGKFIMGKFKSSFSRKVSFLTAVHRPLIVVSRHVRSIIYTGLQPKYIVGNKCGDRDEPMAGYLFIVI